MKRATEKTGISVNSPAPPRQANLAVGNVQIGNNVLLAPMSGVTDAPFRRLVGELGAGLVISEMTASDDLVRGRAMSLLRCESTGVGPHVVQLAGCEARWMSEGARIAEAGGADIIDINMGCPARHVTGGQSGSALMRDLDHALRLIDATVAAVKIPVTLKMRLGWDERSLNAAELAQRAEGAGVRMITVHGRTRSQFYKGQANWSAVRSVKNAVTVPVVVNGDIADYEGAQSALSESGADAVMIGRGAQGQPWLLGQIARRLKGGPAESAPPVKEQLKHLTRLYDAVIAHYGSRVGLRHARKHLSWALDVAAKGTGSSAHVLKGWRESILTATEPAQVRMSLHNAFDDFAWSAAA
ncbi:MAG: tRNA dihydrouridine synthase DusB [Afipia sp.]|nr:tRNA dihydrouridine synthase DusB [Afipia sp.]